MLMIANLMMLLPRCTRRVNMNDGIGKIGQEHGSGSGLAMSTEVGQVLQYSIHFPLTAYVLRRIGRFLDLERRSGSGLVYCIKNKTKRAPVGARFLVSRSQFRKEVVPIGSVEITLQSWKLRAGLVLKHQYDMCAPLGYTWLM